MYSGARGYGLGLGMSSIDVKIMTHKRQFYSKRWFHVLRLVKGQRILWIHGNGRWKGGGREALAPLDFENGCFLSFEWKKRNFTTFGLHPWKSLEKSPGGPSLEKILPTPINMNMAEMLCTVQGGVYCAGRCALCRVVCTVQGGTLCKEVCPVQGGVYCARRYTVQGGVYCARRCLKHENEVKIESVPYFFQRKARSRRRLSKAF